MSSKVEDWFLDFVQMHMDRCQRGDLPQLATDAGLAYWENWRRSFVRIGVTWDVADESSSIVAAKDLFPNAQLAAVVAEAERIFRERRVEETGTHSPGSKDAAEAATPADCECSRGGIVIRFRHNAVGGGTGTSAAGAAISCFCVCPMGRWTRDNLKAEDRRRFLDLGTRLDLQLQPVAWSDRPDCPHRYRPSEWDALNDRPIAVEAHYAADKDALARGVARERKMPQKPRRALVAPVEPTAEDEARAEAFRAKLRQQSGQGGA